MARPNKQWEGILSVPMPNNPSDKDVDDRLIAYIAHLNPKCNANQIFDRLGFEEHVLLILDAINKKVPAFVKTTNIFDLMQKYGKELNNFIFFSEITTLKYGKGYTFKEAYMQYMNENNILYDEYNLEDKIEGLKRKYFEIKANNKCVKKFYNIENHKKIFEILKTMGKIPHDKEFNPEWINSHAVISIIIDNKSHLQDKKDLVNFLRDFKGRKPENDLFLRKIYSLIENLFKSKILY